MKKLTQAEFDAMARDGAGCLYVPTNTDCTEVDFKGAGRVIFGDRCKLGNDCTLGNCCTYEAGRVRHGGTLYEAQYMAACQYAETVLPLMLGGSISTSGC